MNLRRAAVKFMWVIYNIVFTVGFVVMLPYYFMRMIRRGGYRRGFLQRVGIYCEALRSRLLERPRIWIHAVSVGEVGVALKFIAAIRARIPGSAFVISTTTSTGHAAVARALAPGDVLIYYPVDFPPVIRRVLRIIRPTALILAEGELWPNMIRIIRGQGIPVAVINGRLSVKSFRGYRRAGIFLRTPLRMIDHFYMQSEDDAGRIRSLGVEPGRVTVFGSAKYDGAAPDRQACDNARGIFAMAGYVPTDTILLGGSTWPGEEAILLDIYRELKPSQPALKLVLVPRHAERTSDVVSEVEQRGLPFVRRSTLGQGGVKATGSEILLVDTTGELRGLYAAADIIFVGKSLTQHGGQNIIEPAACAKPVLVGPNMENFATIMEDFLAADAIVQVADKHALSGEIRRLIADPLARAELGRRAAGIVARNQGAVAKTVAAMEALLSTPGA